MKLSKINTRDEKAMSKLHYLPFNRAYSIRKELVESMNMFGFILPIIVFQTNLVMGKMLTYILDGQHRLAAARHLGIDAYIITIEPDNVKDLKTLVKIVAAMNSKTKPWSINNYVDAWAYLHLPDYSKLILISEQSTYTVATIAQLLQGIHGRSVNSDRVKDGLFKITHEEETMEALDFARSLSKYHFLSSRMLIALAHVMRMKNFKKDIFTLKFIEEWEAIKELKLDDYTDIFRSWIKG